MARAMFTPSALSATARFSSCIGTSSGTIDCQVGPIMAAPMPPAKAIAIRISMVSA